MKRLEALAAMVLVCSLGCFKPPEIVMVDRATALQGTYSHARRASPRTVWGAGIWAGVLAVVVGAIAGATAICTPSVRARSAATCDSGSPEYTKCPSRHAPTAAAGDAVNRSPEDPAASSPP